MRENLNACVFFHSWAIPGRKRGAGGAQSGARTERSALPGAPFVVRRVRLPPRNLHVPSAVLIGLPPGVALPRLGRRGRGRHRCGSEALRQILRRGVGEGSTADAGGKVGSHPGWQR